MTHGKFDANRSATDQRRDTPAPVPAFVKDVVQSPGRPLETPVRARMEERFAWDFSRVRIHDESTAHDASERLDADAWTIGSRIAFGADRFQPHTQEGERLLGHELTHVVQQGFHSGAMPSRTVSDPADAAEREAGTQPAVPAAAPAAAIHRQPATAAPPARRPHVIVEWDARAQVWRVVVVNVPGIGTVGVAEIPGAKDKKPEVQARFGSGAAVVQIVLPDGTSINVPRTNPGFFKSFPKVAGLGIQEHGFEPRQSEGGAESEGGAGSEGGAESEGKQPMEDRPSVTIESPLRNNEEIMPPPIDPWDPGNLNGRELTEWEKSAWAGGLYDPLLHPVTGAIIGYKKKDLDYEYEEIRDIDGNIVWSAEVPLETPLLDPIDFIPSPGTIAKLGAGIGKKAFGFIFMAGMKGLGKKAAAEAGESLTRRVFTKLMDTFRRMFTKKAGKEAGEEAAKKASGVLTKVIGKQITREAMKEFLEKVIADSAILRRLIKAQGLSGEALELELKAIIQAFEKETGIVLKEVAEGSLGGNLSSLTTEAGKYVIEGQVLKNPALLLGEVRHELAFFFARTGGEIPTLGGKMNASMVLEWMIKKGGTFPIAP